MRKLLLVDDEPTIRYSFAKVFARNGVSVSLAGSISEGRLRYEQDRPDVVILDLKLPDGDGLSLFDEIRAAEPRRPVLVITANGSTEAVIQSMKRGAFEYLTKPLDLERLQTVLDAALDSAGALVPATILQEDLSDSPIVGKSEVMQDLCKLIGRVAATDANVLILGETGTGKELVARSIHQHSARSQRPLVPINCAALPETLVESELFGFEEGAFTGANRQHIGKFEQSDGGTILLDEIGDMPVNLQAKMLRLLQEQKFERLGGNATVTTNARIIAATNQNLERLIKDGKFRNDLFFRLKVLTIRVPPLRKRLEDLPDLVTHFLMQFNVALNRDILGVQPAVLEAFRSYGWPGNIRELQGVLQDMMVNCPGRYLTEELLPPVFAGSAPMQNFDTLESVFDWSNRIESMLRDGHKSVYDRMLKEMERELIVRALKCANGHQSQTSELLGINRTTLRTKIREYGITLDKVVNELPHCE